MENLKGKHDYIDLGLYGIDNIPVEAMRSTIKLARTLQNNFLDKKKFEEAMYFSEFIDHLQNTLLDIYRKR
jgi:hypothetical protein